MKLLSKIVAEEEVTRRNTLRNSCDIQMTAAIEAGDIVPACMFITTILSCGLERAKFIADCVRDDGMSFVEAEDKANVMSAKEI